MDNPGFGNRRRSRPKKKADRRSTLEDGRYSTVRPRDINALPREDVDSSAFDFIDRSPEIVIQNMKTLLDFYKISEEDAHKRIGVDRRWFRRLLKQGLERRMPNLDKVAQYFNFSDGDYLWSKDISQFLVEPPPSPEALDSWTKQMSWPYAQRLLELLETGQHDYLKALIDGLHRMAFARGVMPGQGGGEAPSDAERIASVDRPPADWPEDDWAGKPAYVMPDEEEETSEGMSDSTMDGKSIH